MLLKHSKVAFPFWQFLNQPLFKSDYKLVLNPLRFWHFHQIELLERCLAKEFKPEGRR